MIRAVFVYTFIFYIAAVAIGVSVVHKEFNRMVAPKEPISAFNLNSTGQDALRLEFLGESLEIKIPEAFNLDLLTVESQKVISGIGKEVASEIKGRAEKELSDMLTVFSNAAGTVVYDLYSGIMRLLEHLSEKYLPADWKTSSLPERHNN